MINHLMLATYSYRAGIEQTESHEYSPSDMAEIFTEAERAELAKGLVISRPATNRSTETNWVDLTAFFFAHRNA